MFSQSQETFRILEKDPFYYVYVECRGSYETMSQKISEFINLFFEQALRPDGSLLTVYYNSPEEVTEDQLIWRVGFPVDQEYEVKAPLKTDLYRKKKVLEYLHQGPYDQLSDVYQRIQQYLKENGLKYGLPTYEFYLNDPVQVKPGELLTRIEIPIRE